MLIGIVRTNARQACSPKGHHGWGRSRPFSSWARSRATAASLEWPQQAAPWPRANPAPTIGLL